MVHREEDEIERAAGRRTQPRGSRLADQGAFTFLSRILVTLVNIPISIIIARSLGADGQGVYAAASAFATLWGTLWTLGLDAAHTWILAGGRSSLGRVFGNTVFWIVVITLLAVPSYLLASRLLDPETTRSLLPVFGITAAIVPLIVARYFFMSAFVAMGQIGKYNILSIASQVLLLLALCGALLAGDGGPRAAVLALGGSIFAFVLLSAVWVERWRAKEDRIRFDAGLAKESLSYGLRGYGTTIFTHLNYRFDQVLVTQIAGTTQQGYYSIAVLLAEKLTHITSSIQLVLFPRISASTREEANRITATACRHTLFWVGSGGIVLWLLSPFLVRLFYGGEFLPALSAINFLIPAIFFLTFWKVLATDLSGRNRRVFPAVASLITFGVNTGLNLLWIPRHGMLGAAWSSAVSYLLQSAMVAVFFLRVTGVPILKLVVPEANDVLIYRRIAERLRARVRGSRDRARSAGPARGL
jgi:O-antigen/teichoic acid export membrane protein